MKKVANMNRESCEREYDFTLVLTGITEITPKIEDALYGAGCDDATLAMRSGRPFLTFSRKAATLKDAILSAISAVRKAGIGADVLRVDECNLVTQADIARRIGRSRQLVHQYMTGTRGPGGFPPPACEITDTAPLWYWCEVAYWLCEHDMIPESVLNDAMQLDVINTLLDLVRQKNVEPELVAEILDSVGASICHHE
jgi:transcriptional regulator with XRE-family HTH domain